MKKKHEAKGRAPLFDRLTDLDPHTSWELRPFRTFDAVELRQSVRRELERLLNTRCSIPVDRIQEQERTVINFGIPDLSAFDPENPHDRTRLASLLAQTIVAFEPRLQEVRVTVMPVPGNPRSLQSVVQAILAVDDVREPVSFGIVLEELTGRWVMDENTEA